MSSAEFEYDWRTLVAEKPRSPEVGRPVNRKACIKAALSQGVPLHAIEEYLDWLDSMRDRAPQ